MIAADLLAQIPGCAGGQSPIAVLPLTGGRGCNRVLRVDTPAGSFVLRQRQLPLDRPGSTARTELCSQRFAAAAGLAPRVVAAAPDGSWLLMEYINAPQWTEEQLLSPPGIDNLGAVLAELHGLPLPAGLPPFDAPAIAQGYARLIRSRNMQAAAELPPLLSQVEALSQTMHELAVRPVLNHGDLQIGNLLGSRPTLIDWEYAQVVDPTYDIACLLTYYPRLEPQLDRLMGSAGLANPAAQAVLALQRQRFACLDRLWNLANNAKAG